MALVLLADRLLLHMAVQNAMLTKVAKCAFLGWSFRRESAQLNQLTTPSLLDFSSW